MKVTTTAFLILIATLPAQEVDLFAARKTFQKASRAGDADARREAIATLVATRDPRALPDFQDALKETDRTVARMQDRIEKTGLERAEIWKVIDRQADVGRPVTQVAYDAAVAKAAALDGDLNKLQREREAETAWRDALLDGAGALIAGIPDAPRAELVSTLVGRLPKERNFGMQLMQVEILARARCEPARVGLVELASLVDDGALRTAVVAALASRAERQSIDALARALNDDVWPVRVAAVQGLGDILELSAIGVLVQALGKTEGRTLEEILAALQGQSGVNFHDNAVLWEEWWQKEQEALGRILDQVRSDQAEEVQAGLSVGGDKGFLQGARLALARQGLGRVPTEALPALPPAADAGAAQSRVQTIGLAFRRAAPQARALAVERFLLKPFRNEEDPERLLAYVHQFGQIPSPAIRQALLPFVGEPSPHLSSTEKTQMDRLRLAIVQALAAQPDPATTAALATCLGGKSADIGTEAVRSLHGIRIKESIPALIRGLDSSHAAVKERAQIALADLTGEAFPDAVAWRAWWSQQPLDYKPKAPTTVAADDVSTPAPAGPGTRFYGISTRSKHLVFILDRSGSMEGQDAQGGRKMDVAKKELIEAIRTLPDDATFNIIFYNSDYDLWQKKMTTATPANRKKAIAWVEKVEHVGATNIFDALERAFQLAGRGTHDKAYGLLLDTVFLLSDGLPNRGRLIAVNDILRSVADLNALKQVKIHAIGIGRDHDARLMRGLAELTGGSYIAR